MQDKLRKQLRKLKVLADLRVLWYLRFSKASFLNNQGFFSSYYESTPKDSKGKLLPWMNYCVIHFLRSKLNKNLNVFEYGSGSSTVFFFNLVKQIYSIEHNESFFYQMQRNHPELNDALIYEGSAELYPGAIENVEVLFDVIIIDGIRRNACLDYALQKLSPTGVIVFDDTDRKSYREKIESLFEFGFKELTFIGLKPGGSVALAQTSIIYRPENCFNI